MVAVEKPESSVGKKTKKVARKTAIPKSKAPKGKKKTKKVAKGKKVAKKRAPANYTLPGGMTRQSQADALKYLLEQKALSAKSGVLRDKAQAKVSASSTKWLRLNGFVDRAGEGVDCKLFLTSEGVKLAKQVAKA